MKHFASLKVERIIRILVSFTLLVSNVPTVAAQSTGMAGYSEQAPERQSPASAVEALAEGGTAARSATPSEAGSGLTSSLDYQPLFQTTDEPTPTDTPSPTSTPTPTATPTPVDVTLYDAADYQGQAEFFGVNDPDLSDNLIGAATASSLALSDSSQAILFNRSDYQGGLRRIITNTSDLNTLAFNDAAASLKVLPYPTGPVSITDPFDGPALDSAWNWTSVGGTDATSSLTEQPGQFRLAIPAGDHGYIESTAYVQRYDMGRGDFTLETHVNLAQFTPDSPYWAGLAFGLSHSQPVLFGLTTGDTLRVSRWGRSEAAVPYSGRDVYLRIQYRGQVVTFTYRATLNDDWQPLTTWYASEPVDFVGLFGRTDWGGQALTADFDYFQLIGDDTPTVLPPDPAPDAHDEFTSTLDVAWQWHAPQAGATYSLTQLPGQFQLNIPAGDTSYDTWNDLGPQLQRVDMASDWAIQTRLSQADAGQSDIIGFHTGLIVGFGPTDHFTFGLTYWHQLKLERSWVNNSVVDYLPSTVELRIEKSGDRYLFKYRATADAPWTIYDTQYTPSPVRWVGLATRAWDDRSAPLTFNYEYFDLTGVRPPPPQAKVMRVSVDRTGQQGNSASWGYSAPAISADGRYVAFESYASNLVAEDTNGSKDIFVHDRLTGDTMRVSVDSTGEQATEYSSNPGLSSDGRFVTFYSYADNLVPNDTNGTYDVFMHDRQTGVMERVNVSSLGEEADDGSWAYAAPAISADGRYVVFPSDATNLVDGDTNGATDVFMRDRQTGVTQRVSVDSLGEEADDASGSYFALSANGHYIAFTSAASNLVADDTNGTDDIFVHDRQTGETALVSVNSAGEQADDYSLTPAISGDGRYVVFDSYASNLVADDTNNSDDIFMHDRQTGETTRLSVSSTGDEAIDGSGAPAISADGHYVVFQSYADNLVTDDTNGASDVFLHDRRAHQTWRLSVTADDVQGNASSEMPAIAANSLYVAYSSYADNLVAEDTNGVSDIFVADAAQLLNIEKAVWGIGLRGEYFNNDSLSDTPDLVRIDPIIDFDWGENYPAPEIDYDEFSVRWTGQIVAPTSDDYIFHTPPDSDLRLTLDGQLLIDDWDYDSTEVHLTGGQPYSITLEYFRYNGDTGASLWWSSSSLSSQVVPGDWLYPDTGIWTMTSSPESVSADGQAIATMDVHLSDPAGAPLSNVPVYLQVSGSGNLINGQPAAADDWVQIGESDASGMVTATLASTVAETKVVRARVQNVVLAENTMTFTLPPSSPVLQFLVPDETAAPGEPGGKTGDVAPQVAGTSFMITLRAVDANWNTVTNATDTVTLTTTDPLADVPSSVTLEEGQATIDVILYTAGTHLFQATADAFGSATSAEVTVNPGPAVAENSTLTVAPTQAIADGQSAMTATLTLRDAFDNSAPDRQIDFSVSGIAITITPETTWTDEYGQASATIVSSDAQTITVTAVDVADNLILTSDQAVEFIPTGTDPDRSSFTVSPASLIADGTSVSYIVVTLRDIIDRPRVGHAVTLTVSGSDNDLIGPYPATTGPDGAITFTLASTRVEAKTITVLDSTDEVTLNSQQVITFTGPIDAMASRLETNKTSVRADGQDYAALTVTLLDGYGNPLPNKIVRLQTTGTAITLTQVLTTTDVQGRVQGTLRSTDVQTATVIAIDDTDSVTLTQMIAIGFVVGPVDVAHSTVMLTPTLLAADNMSAAAITVTLRDAADHPLAGRHIQLQVTGGNNVITPSQDGYTDANGTIVFHLATLQVGTKQVTVNDLTDGVSLDAGVVTFESGQPDLIVTTPLTLSAGLYSFNHLTVTNGATLTLQGDVNTGGGVTITAQNIQVDAGTAIVADEQGYVSGSPYGGTNGTAAGGGGHGSWGGRGSTPYPGSYTVGAGGEPYNDALSPTGLGSNGGWAGYPTGGPAGGGAGGGAIRLVVSDTLHVDGLISANGGTPPNGPYGYAAANGGGAGGSIWIQAQSLVGNGSVRANGGKGATDWYSNYTFAGSGSGGRIAIEADTGQFTGALQAYGGAGSTGGGPGTIYLSAPNGFTTLRIDNVRPYGPLGLDAVLLAGAYQFDQIQLARYSGLTILGTTSQLTLTNTTVQGDGTGELNSFGTIYAPAAFEVMSYTLRTKGDLVGVQALTVGKPGATPVSVALYAGTPWHADGYTFTSVVVRSTGQLWLRPSINGNSIYTDDLGFTLNATDVTVETGGSILADGLGYGAATGPGTGVGGNGAGGAGYGGRGGRSSGGQAGGSPYGDLYQPVMLGSGGGHSGYDTTGTAGTGGGAIRLVVLETLALNGSVSAGGAAGVNGTGGGSGGSIWIMADTFTGGGSVRANGGAGGYYNSYTRGGGGSGGRIAIYVNTDTFTGMAEVNGGTGYSDGEHGTVYDGAIDPDRSTIVASPLGNIGVVSYTARITVSLVTTTGLPVSGQPVALNVTGTGNRINGTVVSANQWFNIGNSDANGLATAVVSSTVAQPKVIGARGGRMYVSQPVTVTFVNQPFDPARSTIYTVPASAPADGQTPVTLKVSLRDPYGNAVPGKTVTFTTTDASLILTQPITPTDGTGQTQGRLIASASDQVVTITAAVDGVPLATSTQIHFIGADVSVSQSSPAQALAGYTLTYTLNVRNVGMLTAQGVILADTLPQGATFVTQTSLLPFTLSDGVATWQVGSLTVGAQTSFALVVEAPSMIAAGTSLINRAIVSTASAEANLTNNNTTVTNTVLIPYPVLQLTPTYSAFTLKRGVAQTLALNVTNTGAAAANTITVSAPANLAWVTVSPTSLTDLGPGQSASLTVNLAPPDSVSVGTYRDLVTIQTAGVQQQAAVSVRVVDITRTLNVSVTDSADLLMTQPASVLLVQQAAVPMVTNGVTTTDHPQFQVQAINGSASLQDLEAGTYEYTVWAEGYGAASGVVTITDGAEPQQLTVALTGQPLLTPEPAYPEIYVRPGETGSYQTVIRNAGLGTATNIRVVTPASLPWLYTGVSGTADELASGQVLSVTLFASPPPTLTTPIDYQEYINVSADGGVATRLALTIHVTDQATGAMQVQVTDTRGEPVAGANVALVSKQAKLVVTEGTTQTVYASFRGMTDVSGLATFRDMPAGNYNYYVDAAGYDSAAGDPEVNGGTTSLFGIALEGWNFSAIWSVYETTIPDIYSATVTMTFEADRLQVLPLYVDNDCATNTASGIIEVYNPSDSPVTGVNVSVDIPRSSFSVSGPSTLAPHSGGTYFYTASTAGSGSGRVSASGNGVLSGRSPAGIWTTGQCGDGWVWKWNGPNAVGEYTGPHPSFGGGSDFTPPAENEDAVARLRLSQDIVLDRQAFLATLTFAAEAEVNGLRVYVSARDAQGEDAPSAFTITPTVPTTLPNLAPGGSVTQQWTIVPAELGITVPATYTLKATIVYTDSEGIGRQLPSLPVQVLVNPQPEVHLDYLAPRYVRANMPVLIGVTAANLGAGTASNLRIQSTQPVVFDQAEVPIDFRIIGTYVGGAVQMGETQLEFGDIAPGSVITGGWLMQVSQTGRFTRLDMTCTHQDYQGLALSNLLYCNGQPAFSSNDLQHLNCDECPITNPEQGSAGGPINTQSGNYFYRQSDLSIPTTGDPLKVIRSYSHQEVTSTLTNALSPGWTHHYALRLFFPGPDEASYFGQPTGDPRIDRTTIYYRPVVEAQLAGGSRIRFAQNDDGTYSTYPGAQATLTRQQVGPVFTYTLTASNQAVYVFDTAGRLIAQRDPHDNETHLTYAGDRLTRVTDPTGQRWLSFDYDAAGRITEVRDPIDRRVQYGYDAAGDLTVMTDTLGLAWTYVYTGSHLLHAIYNPAGELIEQTDYTSTTIDGQIVWRATSQVNGAGVPLTLTYAADGQTAITEAGRQRVDYYDPFGALAAQANALGQTHSLATNYDFRRERTVDALGNQTQMTWSADGFNLTSMTDAQGHITRMAYDAANHLTAYIDAGGRPTTFDYAGNNLLAQTNALSQTTRYAYDQWGHVISTTTPTGQTTQTEYDDFGQPIVITDATGLVTRREYDAVGRLITTTAPTGLMGVNEYDAADRLIRVTANYTTAGGQNYLNEYNLVTEYGYDLAGRQVAVTDTVGHVNRSVYDDAGRLIESIQNYKAGEDQNYLNLYNLTTKYGYDEVGRQYLVTDTLGHMSKTEYDVLNRPVTMTTNYLAGGPIDAVTNLTRTTGYDANGNVVTQTDTLGRLTVTQYDTLNRPVTVTANYVDGIYDPAHPDEDLSTITVYDDNGQTAAQRDAAGHWSYSAYDELGRLITSTNALSGTSVTVYNDVGQRVAAIDPAGNTTHYAYDTFGRLITTTDALSNTTITVYDALGRRATTLDALGRSTGAYTYSLTGRLVATADAGGAETKYEYDVLGRTVVVTDALGHATHTAYDELGRVVTTTNALSGTMITEYDASGRRTRTRDARGNWTAFEYDDLGRVITTTDATGRAMVSVYNRAGNNVETRSCYAGVCQMQSHFEYDRLGRLIAQSDALSNTTRYVYDAAGNRVAMIDANGIETRYGYDVMSRLISVTENYSTTGPSNNQTNLVTRYGYDQIGNRIVMTNARNYTTTYTYGALSRQIEMQDARGKITGYGYDAIGNRTILTDANGEVSLYAYDVLNRPLAITYTADLTSVQYAYNALGNRTAMTDSLGVTRFTYDELNRLIEVTDPFTGTVQYGYDANGNRTQLIYPDGKVVTSTYDAANRLTTVVDWGEQSTTYAYDGVGRLVTTTLPNGVQTINTYDAASRLTRLAHVHDGEAVGQYDYELDPIGNRTALTETLVVSGSASAPATPAPDPHSLWDDTAVPAEPAVGDTDPVELGVRFESDVDGYITGLRFYKGTTNTGTHVGRLWTIGGKLLASVTFTNETASGWQTATFAYPVAIVSNTLYVASYYVPTGHFAVTREYFTSARERSPLRAPASGEIAGGNGVYVYPSGFPNQNAMASNYWVDAIFDTTPPPITTEPFHLWGDTVTPAGPSSGDANPVELGVRFESLVDGYLTGLRFYKGDGNTGPHVGNLWTISGTLLASATFTNETTAGWQTVTFSTPVAIMSNTIYVASYYAPAGHYAITGNYFAAAYAQSPLRAPASAEVAGGNGVYLYYGGFPIHSYYHANYWVDVVFQTALSTTTTLTTTVTTTAIAYTYDPLSRLTDATYSNGQRFQYAYDQVGNRTVQTATITSTQTTAYVYDAANRLTSVNGQAYSWDDNGNLLNDGSTMYAYDQANRLISATLGLTTTQYAYNGDGARLKQVMNGSPTTYTLDLAAPLVQVLVMQDAQSAGGTTAYEYGLTRIGEQQSTGWVYHLSDALGSVRQLTDGSGQITLARGYTPYGEPLWSQGDGQSVYGFTGEALDTYIKLVFLRARYMQPRLGMFLARDPWKGNPLRPVTLNAYGYAGSNPILWTDPLGLDFYRPRLIEDSVESGFIVDGRPDSWLAEAIRIHPVDEVYRRFLERLLQGNVGNSIWNTLPLMYIDIRQLAWSEILRTPNCLNAYEALLEANHIALIAMSDPPANHRMDLWRRYPLYLPQSGRQQELGWDKSGHFLVNALMAFESRYTLKYPGTDYFHMEPYMFQIGDLANVVEYVVGSRNIEAIEQDYVRNQDVGYIDSTGLSGYDAHIFNILATIGNSYELLTSFRPSSERDKLEEFLKLRVTLRGDKIDAITDEVLSAPKSDDINEGLQDSGVYRDFRANRLGVRFGLTLFHNPLAVPPGQ